MTYRDTSGLGSQKIPGVHGSREVESLSNLRSKYFMSRSFILCYILSLKGSGLSDQVSGLTNIGPTHTQMVPDTK